MMKVTIFAGCLLMPLAVTAKTSPDALTRFAAYQQMAGNVGYNCQTLEQEIVRTASILQNEKPKLLAQYREAEKVGALWGIEEWYVPLMELSIPAAEANHMRYECEQQVDLIKEGRQSARAA